MRTPWVEAALRAVPGEVVAVMGRNGSGKTSLLRALAGLVPGAGSVQVRGREVGHLPPYARGVGWVPQGASLFPHLSARDNAAYALRCQGTGRRRARETAQSWLERLDVGHLGDARPAALSGGQTACVALARALAADPDLLLLDEPLAALDHDARARVRRTLRESVRGGRATTLLITHDRDEARELADRVVVLEQGRVVQDGRPDVALPALGSRHDAAHEP